MCGSKGEIEEGFLTHLLMKRGVLTVEMID